MEKKINKISGIIVGILLLIGLIVFFYKKNQFMIDYKFTTGHITEVNAPGWKNSGDYAVLYQYVVGNKVYQNNNNFKFCNYQTMQKMRIVLKDKKFPVAYSTKDATMSIMLITKKDAERFKYKIPDSLLIYDSILTCK